MNKELDCTIIENAVYRYKSYKFQKVKGKRKYKVWPYPNTTPYYHYVVYGVMDDIKMFIDKITSCPHPGVEYQLDAIKEDIRLWRKCKQCGKIYYHHVCKIEKFMPEFINLLKDKSIYLEEIFGLLIRDQILNKKLNINSKNRGDEEVIGYDFAVKLDSLLGDGDRAKVKKQIVNCIEHITLISDIRGKKLPDIEDIEDNKIREPWGIRTPDNSIKSRIL